MSEAARISGFIISRGKQRWRQNPNKTWSVLMFGSFSPGQVGLCWRWAAVPEEKVPQDVLDLVK
jgi:hypothetical protein